MHTVNMSHFSFRQRSYCFTPYIGTARDLTRQQQDYNIWHGSARAVVECVNGQLKQRFRLVLQCCPFINNRTSFVPL